MKYNYPLVSIVSVNFNETDVTCEFLQSLQKCTYPNIQVILVDNGSRRNDEVKFRKNFRNLEYIRSEENLGFAGGNNLGIAKAEGEFLMFLNNDTEVSPGFLEPLVHIALSQENVGMVCPKIVFSHARDTIQFAGCTPINPFTGRGRGLAYMAKDEGQFNYIKETALGNGAAMLVPKKVIDSIGTIPEIFFLYYEEHDWTEMIKRAGYKIMYNGWSKVYHKESFSVGKRSPLKTYYLTRNRLVYLRRNTKGLLRLSSVGFFALVSVPVNTLRFLVSRELKLLKAFYRGVLWNVIHWRSKQVQ